MTNQNATQTSDADRINGRIEMRTFSIDSETESATANLKRAIETMKNAIEDAERALAQEDLSLSRKTARVLHAIAWGHANATSNIENAMSSAERIAKIEAERAALVAELQNAK